MYQYHHRLPSPRPPPSASILVCWFCLINFLRAIKQPATDIIGPPVLLSVLLAGLLVSGWMLNVSKCQQWAQSTCHSVIMSPRIWHLTSVSPLLQRPTLIRILNIIWFYWSRWGGECWHRGQVLSLCCCEIDCDHITDKLREIYWGICELNFLLRIIQAKK